jgi:hypothetical protein
VKHYLWHGNVARARDKIGDIDCFLENEELTGENSRKLKKALDNNYRGGEMAGEQLGKLFDGKGKVVLFSL